MAWHIDFRTTIIVCAIAYFSSFRETYQSCKRALTVPGNKIRSPAKLPPVFFPLKSQHSTPEARQLALSKNFMVMSFLCHQNLEIYPNSTVSTPSKGNGTPLKSSETRGPIIYDGVTSFPVSALNIDRQKQISGKKRWNTLSPDV